MLGMPAAKNKIKEDGPRLLSLPLLSVVQLEVGAGNPGTHIDNPELHESFGGAGVNVGLSDSCHEMWYGLCTCML